MELKLDLAYMRDKPPKALIKKLYKTLTFSNEYPSGDYSTLKSKIAGYAKVRPENVFLGNGSDEVINIIGSAFGRKSLIPVPTFSQFEASAKRCNYSIKNVNCLKNSIYKVEFSKKELLDATLIWICTPNNPTGTKTPVNYIKEVLDCAKGVVAVDECLYEYSGETCVDLLKKYKNLVIIRSMSKAFGIAGLRLGYALASVDMIKKLESLRQPFNVNKIAESAGILVFDYLKYFTEKVNKIKNIRSKFCKNLDKLGIKYMESEAPFIFVDFRTMKNAKYVYGMLKRYKITAFPAWDEEFTGPIVPFIRFSIGKESAMDYVIEVLRKVIKYQ
jgi:histidinol-phosphate aminotransferase